MEPTPDVTVNAAESWELVVGVDTPAYHQALTKQLADAAHIQKQATHILSLAEAAARASEQAAIARRDLAQAIAQTGGAAFEHSELAPTAEDGAQHAASAAPHQQAPVSVSSLMELFSQLEVAEAMHVRQLQSLVIEPLTALVNDSRGLGTVPRLAQVYGSVSHEFYESLNEYMSLDGESGASAGAAKAHAKATAKATAKAGAAVMSSVSSRLGAGFGMFGRKLNQTLNQASAELAQAVSQYGSGSDGAGGAVSLPPTPAQLEGPSSGSPSAPTEPPAEGGAGGGGGSGGGGGGGGSGRLSAGEGLMNSSAREALAELRSGSTTLSDTQAAVLRHQERCA